MASSGRSPRRSPSISPWEGCCALLLAVAIAIGSTRAQALWPFASEPWGKDRPLGERAAAILSRAIAFPSVNPPGDEEPVARFFVDVAGDLGLEAGLIASPSGDGSGDESGDKAAGPRRAGAWARLPGRGDARPIVLLSHLDVVPADPSEWTVPPFEGRIEDGYVVGRGALDAKGVAVVQLMALAELARRDEPLSRDVIWIATPDEEAGGRLGAGRLVREQPELLGNAEFLLTEGGNVRAPTARTPSVWGVSVTEKSPCWLELSARGPPGHTSAPAPDAAVPRLVAALDKLRRIETRVEVIPEVQRMFAAQAAAAPPEDQADYRDLARSLDEDRDFRRRFLDNPARNALVRDTLSLTVLEGAPRTNVAPALARAHVDARLLPGESCEAFASAIASVVADQAVSVRILLSFDALASPIDTPLYRAIEDVAARVDPGAVVVPRMMAGFTDAHWFREIGIVSYGFVPRWLSAEETQGIHGTNERVSIENLERGTRTLVEILEELDRQGGDPP